MENDQAPGLFFGVDHTHGLLLREMPAPGEQRKLLERSMKLGQVGPGHVGGDSEAFDELEYDLIVLKPLFKELKDQRAGNIQREHPAAIDIQNNAAIGTVNAAWALGCWRHNVPSNDPLAIPLKADSWRGKLPEAVENVREYEPITWKRRIGGGFALSCHSFPCTWSFALATPEVKEKLHGGLVDSSPMKPNPAYHRHYLPNNLCIDPVAQPKKITGTRVWPGK
jgi:hypothetical protein